MPLEIPLRREKPGKEKKEKLLRACGFLRFCFGVLALEFLDPTCGIKKFLFSREKRMAFRTDFHVQIFHGGSRFHFCPASAADPGFKIFWMNA